jgi:UDPglucose 6-dehydrogenase/GDP-mannose 6-dehydrogenase
MKVAIVGTGYVGLVSGVCLAAKGHDVICVDTNAEIVEKLNRGEPTIYEKDLQTLLKKTISDNKFRVTQNIKEALNFASIVMIAVGTPSVNGSIDLTHIRKASQEIGSYIANTDKFITVIVKSTVVPGTTDTVVREEIEKISLKNLGEFGLGMNPEFLREGKAVSDFNNPDRIILGYETERTLSLMNELYKSWNVEKICTNSRTAELIKYANNMLLATQISAVNEIANLASALGGIDVMEVMKGVHLDKRWNPIINGSRAAPEILNYLIPGCGFGGSCFNKDLEALRSQGKLLNLEMNIVNAVININNDQPYQVVKMLETEFGDLSKKKFLILGLAFKPDTDDARESPAIKIVKDLIAKHVSVAAHDPVAVKNFKLYVNSPTSTINYVYDWKDSVAKSDIIIIATPWTEYRCLAKLDISGKIIFDAKRAFFPQYFSGAIYRSIGMRI